MQGIHRQLVASDWVVNHPLDMLAEAKHGLPKCECIAVE